MISQELHHYALLLSLLISMLKKQKTKARPLSIQSTPDNSNLPGKSKKVKLAGVRIIGNSKQISGNIGKWDGE